VSNLFFPTQDSHSLCQRKLLLRHSAPVLKRHGSSWVYYFPEPQRITLWCWTNGTWTSYTSEVAEGCVLHHTSKCATTTKGFQTAPDLLGSEAEIGIRTPQLYAPDKVTVFTTYEFKTLEEIIPPEVARPDRVSSVVTAPRHVSDVNTLLHVTQASMRRKHNTNRYFILIAAFGTFVILILSYAFLQPLLCKTCATCREKRNAAKRITSHQTPNLSRS
jgi:hypothetical protein